MAGITYENSGLVLLSAIPDSELAALVANRLGVTLGDLAIYQKTNRESTVDVKQSVRGKHVFILQTGSKNVNNDVIELLILIYACKTSTAKSITVVVPYLFYSKQCRVLRRSAITSKLVADLIVKSGANRLVCMDLYKKEIQGFYSIPVDNLRASLILIQYIQQGIPDYKNAVIVAKSPEVLNKATSYSERLRLSLAVIHGTTREEDESGTEDGRQSPPARSSVERNSPSESREKAPLTVVGDVGGKIAVLVDDMLDDAQSFVEAAKVLKKRGAYKVYVVATHGLLSGDAAQRLEDSCITEIILTNTVRHDVQKLRCHKIRTVDISMMLCEAIRCIYNNESMGSLFRDMTIHE